jgi:hypothetical protein
MATPAPLFDVAMSWFAWHARPAIGHAIRSASANSFFFMNPRYLAAMQEYRWLLVADWKNATRAGFLSYVAALLTVLFARCREP